MRRVLGHPAGLILTPRTLGGGVRGISHCPRDASSGSKFTRLLRSMSKTL